MSDLLYNRAAKASKAMTAELCERLGTDQYSFTVIGNEMPCKTLHLVYEESWMKPYVNVGVGPVFDCQKNHLTLASMDISQRKLDSIGCTEDTLSAINDVLGKYATIDPTVTVVGDSGTGE